MMAKFISCGRNVGNIMPNLPLSSARRHLRRNPEVNFTEPHLSSIFRSTLWRGQMHKDDSAASSTTTHFQWEEALGVTDRSFPRRWVHILR